MMKILVTGGAGFVGSSLCRRLSQTEDNEVISLDNYFTGSKSNHVPNVKYLTGHTRDIDEILKSNHVTGIDLIYHLGEYSRVEKSFEDPTSLVWDLNVAGTFAVLEYCKKNKCKIVYAGSSTKFAENGSNMSPYAWTKASNTNLVRNFGDWFGVKYAISYFYNVYGEGEINAGPYATIIGIFKKQFQSNTPLTVVKPGDQKRNFTHIDDIVDAMILIGEKGVGDEYGIGADEAFSISEVANMFDKDFVWMPERRGNRMSAGVMSEKTKALGWSPKRSLTEHINEFKKLNQEKQNERKNKVLVFATTFYPNEGLCELALRKLIETVPNINFDIITTNLGKDGTVQTLNLPNVNVYRIGNGNGSDKIKLMRQGFIKALELSKTNNYAFVWSVMSSYGTLPALRIKNKLKLPLLITLGDQRLPRKSDLRYLFFKLFVKGSDQVSTNSVIEANVSRVSNLNWLSTFSKKGDTFTNAFRFAYNMIFAEVYKEAKNQ